MVTKKALESALGIAVNENKMLNRALELACEDITNKSCSLCPHKDCPQEQAVQYQPLDCKGCYIEYYIDKAKAEVGNEED